MKVIEGRDIAREPGSRANPFVCFTLGQDARQTRERTAGSSRDPIWDQEFRFHNVEAHQRLETVIKDRSDEGPTFGIAVLPIGQLVRGKLNDLWLPLMKYDSKSGTLKAPSSNPKVRMQVTAIGFGVDTYSSPTGMLLDKGDFAAEFLFQGDSCEPDCTVKAFDIMEWRQETSHLCTGYQAGQDLRRWSVLVQERACSGSSPASIPSPVPDDMWDCKHIDKAPVDMGYDTLQVHPPAYGRRSSVVVRGMALTVHIVEACNLVARNLKKNQTPVVLASMKTSFKTRPARNSDKLNPQWNETITLGVFDPKEDVLNLSVGFQQDAFSTGSENGARAEVQLHRLHNGDNDLWVQLAYYNTHHRIWEVCSWHLR